MDQKLNRKQAAALLQIGIRTLDYLVSTNQIPFSRIGKRIVRFDAGRLDEYFQQREGIEFRHRKPAGE